MQPMDTQDKSTSPTATVIVVDDDAAVRNSLKFSLEIEGFAVRLYESGPQLLHDHELSDCIS